MASRYMLAFLLKISFSFYVKNSSGLDNTSGEGLGVRAQRAEGRRPGEDLALGQHAQAVSPASP